MGLIGPQGESWLPPAAIDQGGLGYAALRLHRLTGGEHYLHFAQALGEWLSCQPGAEDGHIPYTVGHRLVLVDTVGMICPFLARLAHSSGNIRYRQIALAQLEAIWQVGDTDRGWTYHAFYADSLQPVGMRGWGRGIGWLLLGIVDTLCELESSPERNLWLSRGEKLLAALQTCQRSDGHWPWRFDDPKAHPDSSVTALVAYCLARWRQMIGAHPFSHMEKLANDALTAATDQQGNIGGGSGEAGGVGNYNPSFGHYLWTQGLGVATVLLPNEPTVIST
jgi:unsaturated rhamnogalacturonyl hydrolase